jgi:hypothetical protein
MAGDTTAQRWADFRPAKHRFRLAADHKRVHLKTLFAVDGISDQSKEGTTRGITLPGVFVSTTSDHSSGGAEPVW